MRSCRFEFIEEAMGAAMRILGNPFSVDRKLLSGRFLV